MNIFIYTVMKTDMMLLMIMIIQIIFQTMIGKICGMPIIVLIQLIQLLQLSKQIIIINYIINVMLYYHMHQFVMNIYQVNYSHTLKLDTIILSNLQNSMLDG